MSDTPQNDDVINEDVNAKPVTNDSVPASDTGSPVQDESNEQVDEVAVAQEKANKAFNTLYGKNKQGERDLEAANLKIASFEQGERERQAAAVGNIPPMPEEFDDNYAEKLKAHIAGSNANAVYVHQNNTYLQQQQFTQQQGAQAAQVKVQESMASYSQKATELGIKQEELQAAGNVVANYGLSQDLIMHILGDSDGPLITKHLAANPQDGHQLAGMSPFAVGQFLDGIKAKASALKPKTSNTPSPATNLQGNGVQPDDGYKNIKGAKFT